MHKNKATKEYYLGKISQSQKLLEASIPEEKLLTRKEAAKILSLNFNTLKRWASSGEHNLPFLKIGKLVRYKYSDLLQFMHRKTVFSTKDETAIH